MDDDATRATPRDISVLLNAVLAQYGPIHIWPPGTRKNTPNSTEYWIASTRKVVTGATLGEALRAMVS